MVRKAGKKVEMAGGLSNLHVLDVRAHNPGELMEHCARNSSSPLTHASAESTWRTDIPTCDGNCLWSGPVGDLEGKVFEQVLGGGHECDVSCGISPTVPDSDVAWLGPPRKLADCFARRARGFLVAGMSERDEV